VTGGGSGIGAALARAKVAAGPHVVCTDIDGGQHGDVLNDIMQEWCDDKTKAEIPSLLQAAKLPAAPLHSTQDVLDDPHVAAMGYLRRVPFPGASRDVPIIEMPFRMSATPGTIRSRAPLLGEHTDEVLGQVGYGGDEIAGLRARSII
jgi:crotonobetainyl-CoA:carnitine CoA-transferase CaiB-like acyl-CoA transferase